MSDSKKPTVSEIRARPLCFCPWNPAGDRDYLLALVERLGKSNKLLVAWLDNQPDGRGKIESMILKEARALLEELKQ